MMNWYALFVTTGKEEDVVDWLKIYLPESEVTTLIPKRKLLERRQGKLYQVLKKMFPGYVLLNMEMDTRTYYILKKIPNFIRILSSGEYYTRIPPEEMAALQHLLGNTDVVDCSQVYLKNSRVLVKSGPLKGREGLIKAVDRRKFRARIELQFMGLPKEIDLGIEVLDPLPDHEGELSEKIR